MKIAQTKSIAFWCVFTKDRSNFMTRSGSITALPSYNTKGRHVESYFRHFKMV